MKPVASFTRTRYALAAFLLAAAVYTITFSGHLSSPDSEVVLRTAVSLATEGSLAIEPIQSFSEFGYGKAEDGTLYSVFGPAVSVLMVPAILLSDATLPLTEPLFKPLINRVRFLVYYPSSYPEHMRRLFALFVNMLIMAAAVGVLCAILLRITTPANALMLSCMFAFGTFAWAYSRTLFSEPLAIFTALLSLLMLMRNTPKSLAAAGLALGISCTSHITSVLFIPFYIVFALWPNTLSETPADSEIPLLRRAITFIAPLAMMLILLGVYNYIRFDNPFETGRQGNYGEFFLNPTPWWALLVSGNKGLLWYAPALLALPLFFTRALRRPTTVVLLLGIVLLRYVFICVRNDWSGGFCVGPRFLLPVLPFIFIAAGYAAGKLSPRRRWLALATLLVTMSFMTMIVSMDPLMYYSIIRDKIAADPQLQWKMLWTSFPLSMPANLQNNLPTDFLFVWALRTGHPLWLAAVGAVMGLLYAAMKYLGLPGNTKETKS